MIGRSVLAVLRLLAQLWPLPVGWIVWDFATTHPDLLQAWIPASIIHVFDIAGAGDGSLVLLAALVGPAVIMLVALLAHAAGIASANTAIAGILSMPICAWLTLSPHHPHLWTLPDAASTVPLPQAFTKSRIIPAFIGTMGAFVAFCVGMPKEPLGSRAGPSLRRSTSDNFGHADWMTVKEAQARFPGPHPKYGGIVVGEAYRVDEDLVAKHSAFDPEDRRSWGRGGKAPLLIDPCRRGSTHALVFAGSGGFKTTSVAIPTLLSWSGSAVVLDPSREVEPMIGSFRRQNLGHRVLVLDPMHPASDTINVLDWIDTTSPKAESQVATVVGWITGERRNDAEGGSGAFFTKGSRRLIGCMLADLLWDTTRPPDYKTLRTLRMRLTIPEDDMIDQLEGISINSASPLARDLANQLKGAVKETFSGIYQNAAQDTQWLSTAAYAALVSGGASGATCRTRELTTGRTTAFVQVPLEVLQHEPALGRVLTGALLNAVYQADGAIDGRVLFLLDEVARLGYMGVIETARDAGRKYGITLLLLYQSLGQLVTQWGREGKQAWFDSTAWQLFAAIQDWDTARQVSEMCGEYGVVAMSTGDTEGTQKRGGLGASSSSGRSESRSEMKRPLIKPEELRNDTRPDEAFVLAGGSKPLRCGRAIWFRRPQWLSLVGENRFHKATAG